MVASSRHAELCDIAARWLRLPESRGSHGCQVAFVEPRVSYLDGECPDAIGFRVGGRMSGSVVVECKASRSDFLADRRKPHRQDGAPALGRWRYLLCPDGLVAADELLPGWGLLTVGERNRVTVVSGAATAGWAGGRRRFCAEVDQERRAWTFLDHDALRETLLLANLLHRLGNPGAMNTRLRNAESVTGRLIRENERLRQQVRSLETASWIAEASRLSGERRTP